MSFIKREWTPENADEMHKEDWFAIFFSVISYIALMVGAAMSALLIPAGFVILFIGILIFDFLGSYTYGVFQKHHRYENPKSFFIVLFNLP